MRRLFVALSVVAMSLVMVSSPASATAVSGSLKVDGYSLAVKCTGSGPRTVILLSGFGDSLGIWSGIQRSLSKHNRVCSYDRPGEGGSSTPRGVQTIGSEAVLLHDLLAALKVHGRVILAGHSLGGDIAAWYAKKYVRHTAGVVLFDATPTGFLQFTARLIPANAGGLAGALRQEAVTSINGKNPEHLKVTGMNWAAPGSLRHIPLAVAEHGKDIFAATGRYDGPLQGRWARGQLGWAVMSSRSEVVIATRSGHYIYLDQPQLALDLIRAVISES